jgi:hypothetical protein
VSAERVWWGGVCLCCWWRLACVCAQVCVGGALSLSALRDLPGALARLSPCDTPSRPAAAGGHTCVPPDHQATGPAAPRRWGEVSGKHVDLQIGDICDWEFLSQAFEVGACCSERCASCSSSLRWVDRRTGRRAHPSSRAVAAEAKAMQRLQLLVGQAPGSRASLAPSPAPQILDHLVCPVTILSPPLQISPETLFSAPRCVL